MLPLFRRNLENAPHQNDGKCYKVNDCFHFGNNHFTNQFKLTSIRKSGPEIENRCTQEGINRGNLTSIRKSGPEIENRCSGWAVLEVFLAAIVKFTP